MLAFRAYLFDLIWTRDFKALPKPVAMVQRVSQFFFVVMRDLFEGQLTLRAMSLVYTTVLSLVPLLAFSFSLLKGLGIHNKLEPVLFAALEGLGPKGQELGEKIMSFVNNIRADLLGTVGLAILIYTVISLLQKIEGSFNYVWRVQQPRSFARRFSDYLSVIIVGPLLVVSALTFTATATNNAAVQALLAIEPLGTIYLQLLRLSPYLLVIAAFTFTYVFIPNTKVRIVPALTGGLIAGVLWEWMGKLFAWFVGHSASYTAIYSGLAIIFFFMIWLYVGWIILLIGAQIAFYRQHPQLVVPSKSRLQLSNRLREKLALLIMFQVGNHYFHKKPLWNLDSLSVELHVPGDLLETLTRRLEKHGMLLVTEDERYIPGRDMETISLMAIINAVRDADLDDDYSDEALPDSGHAVNHVMGQLDEAIQLSLGERNLRELIQHSSS